jgi:uncharacterized DUF497 family protein
MTDILTPRFLSIHFCIDKPWGRQVRVAWDETKNQANQRDHKVSFELAREVFADPLALSKMDRVEDGEQRWQTVGMVSGTVILLVAHTVHEREGEEVIRIISARKATKHERRAYEDE